MIRSRAFALLGVLGASCVAACSGGSSSPAPQPATEQTPPGAGLSVPLDQKVNFTVNVPAAAKLAAIAAAVRKRAQANASATSGPYVSPNTGSVSVQLQTVNGQSLVQIPPAQGTNIPTNCIGSASGCSVPLDNVPAAKGVNRFAVQTFSGQNETGNIVSTGFVDVTVPAPASASIGGTALTVGGFVQAIVLTLNPPGGNFAITKASTATLDVNAIDPAGAIIIGNSALVPGITLTLPASDQGFFSLGAAGTTTLSLQTPAQSIPLIYTGGYVKRAEVDATTTDANGNPVATALPISVGGPPPPTPTPSPTPTPIGATPSPIASPLSIYVYDASQDRILEYDGVRAIEGGIAPNPAQTPRRVFDFAVDPNAYPNCSVAGPGANDSFPDLGGIVVDTTGKIYAESKCTDAAAASSYTFSYPPATHELATPPPANVAFSVFTGGANLGFAAQPYGIQLDSAHGNVVVAYGNSGTSGVNLLAVPFGSNSTVTNIASACITEIGAPSPCSAPGGLPANGYYGVANFALDAAGFAYVPTSYNDVTPVGPVAAHFVGEPAVAVLPAGAGANPAPVPVSALAGIPDELGGGTVGGGSAPVVATDGSTLYALGVNQQYSVGNDYVFPGLSACPPPNANAPIDASYPNPTNGNPPVNPNCSDQQSHTYLVGFPAGILATLTGPATAQNLLVNPRFILGGDSVGLFGYANGGAYDGDTLRVLNGFAYVLNNEPTLAGASGAPPYSAELDVYDIRSVSGNHTDVAPFARIALPASVFPTALAIGPTGTGTGGVALLRRPTRAHHDLRAWLQKNRLRVHGLRRR